MKSFTFLFLLVFALFTLISLEGYFVNFSTPTSSKIYRYCFALFSHGYWFRGLFALLYPFLFSFRLERSYVERTYEVGQVSFFQQWKKSPYYPRIKAAGIMAYLIGSVALVLAHALPSITLFNVCIGVSLLLLALGGIVLGLLMKPDRKPLIDIPSDRRKIENARSFSLKLEGRGYINIPNPARGVLVIGGAGSGKSYSVAEPLIEQATRKHYAGVLYDFKFPTLSTFAYQCHAAFDTPVALKIVNFTDLERTHRVNPLHPDYIKVAAYATEFANAIFRNLAPDSIGKTDFWISSSTAYLASIIWFLKRNYPTYCTLPHVMNLITGFDYNALVELLRQDYECKTMIQSVVTAIDLNADKQISGVISTIQNLFGAINTPTACYVLSGHEFSLDLNNKAHPTLLCIGTSPTLVDSLSPLVSLIITVASKLMNTEGKHHSYLLLDEAPQCFIPNFSDIPATARSNFYGSFYFAQDLSQMRKKYKTEETQAIVANLATQLYGRCGSVETAKTVSELLGEKQVLKYSESLKRDTQQPLGDNRSVSLGASKVFPPDQLLKFQPGQFVGTVVECEQPYFFGKIVRENLLPRNTRATIPAFRKDFNPQEVEVNFYQIIQECKGILEGTIPPLKPFQTGID